MAGLDSLLLSCHFLPRLLSRRSRVALLDGSLSRFFRLLKDLSSRYCKKCLFSPLDVCRSCLSTHVVLHAKRGENRLFASLLFRCFGRSMQCFLCTFFSSRRAVRLCFRTCCSFPPFFCSYDLLVQSLGEMALQRDRTLEGEPTRFFRNFPCNGRLARLLPVFSGYASPYLGAGEMAIFLRESVA